MPEIEERVAIIALDGLSLGQFEQLQALMPLCAALLKNGHLQQLDATPFSDAHPIWAEILTGEPWYSNGCVGYATLQKSLNELRLFRENDLLCPVTLLPEVAAEQRNIVINMPLLEPREHERIWLAEASSAVVTHVSPASLQRDKTFADYKPRPILSMGLAMADHLAVTRFIECELNRLACATALIESNWKSFVYRITIFDQLIHLLGNGFLDATLICSAQIRSMLAKLDKGLSQILSHSSRFIFLSAFSHTTCKEIFSLNDFFEDRGLQEKATIDQKSKQAQLRQQAFMLIQDENGPPLVSADKQILLAKTKCASPIRGAVYINDSERFSEGSIDSSAVRTQVDIIANLLASEFRRFPTFKKLICNPIYIDADQQTSETRKTVTRLSLPDLIVDVPGLDFVENLDAISRDYDLPPSVHTSSGFVWSMTHSDKGTSIKSFEVANLLSRT